MEKVFQILKAEISVPPLIPANATRVFVLESPHVDEVLHGIPAAGSTGSEMSKVLFDEPTPLGRILFAHAVERRVIDGADEFGLLNAVSIPMQVDAVPVHLTFLDEISYFMGGLRAIKEHPETENYGDDNHTALRDILIRDLTARLRCLPSSVRELIPCGEVSKELLGRVAQETISRFSIMTPHLPHPTRNHWSAKKEEIREILGIHGASGN